MVTACQHGIFSITPELRKIQPPKVRHKINQSKWFHSLEKVKPSGRHPW
jgi:hypothetical protein